MSVEEQFCPICGSDGVDRVNSGDASSVTCRRCGKFSIAGTAEAVARANPAKGRALANLSGWVRDHQGVKLDSRELESLRSLRSPTIAERATKLLQDIARRHPTVGEAFDIAFPDVASQDPTWISATWSESIQEVQYLFMDFLMDSLSALEGHVSNEIGERRWLNQVRITPHGHQLLQELREGNPESPIGFCAMWFSEEVKPLWLEGIEPAIRLAGYDPKRIDQHEHVGKIDDEIVAMIRRSRFVVADFTGQRGGVYFEAGFALGLGLKVIWLCRDDELEKVHFDTRQYNFLKWKPGEYADLAKRLQDRIEANLGRGPIRA